MHALRLKPVNPINQAHVSLMGKLLYYLFPYRSRVIQSNIHQVYGNQLSVTEKKHLMQAFYSHLASCIKETFSVRFMSTEQLKQKVKVIGHEHVSDVAKAGKGVLILTAHIGNWEFAPLGAMLHFEAFTGYFHFIRRTLSNKTLERILFNRYFKAGLRIIPKQAGSLNQVCDALDQNHAVVFVLDQHASLVNRDGIAVEFFGKKAGTYRSLASIARHTQVPVIPTSTHREPDGNHVLIFHPPIFWQDHASTQAALYHNTKVYNEALERMILAHPAQWMWVHKRWKL
jgi:KDO2-lipid IV(A) lauroyltransferase